MEKDEKNIVTKEEALERINENFEEIDSAYGKIRVSKIFFKVCAGIGIGATVVGVAGIATLGFALAPVATTGLGIASAATGLIFNKGENDEYARMQEAEERNIRAKRSIVVKEVLKEEKAKQKVKA